MLRALVALAGLMVASTGVTPFDMLGFHMGADHVAELTVTMIVLVGMFFVLKS